MHTVSLIQSRSSCNCRPIITLHLGRFFQTPMIMLYRIQSTSLCYMHKLLIHGSFKVALFKNVVLVLAPLLFRQSAKTYLSVNSRSNLNYSYGRGVSDPIQNGNFMMLWAVQKLNMARQLEYTARVKSANRFPSRSVHNPAMSKRNQFGTSNGRIKTITVSQALINSSILVYEYRKVLTVLTE